MLASPLPLQPAGVKFAKKWENQAILQQQLSLIA